MTCSENRILISAYLDSELDSRSSFELEKHMQNCEVCKNNFEMMHLMKSTVTLLKEEDSVPQPKVPGLVSWAPQKNFLKGLASGIAASFLLIFYFKGILAPNHLSNDLIDLHLHSLQANHLIDVASSEHHVIKPWFSGQIDFTFNPENFETEGYKLLGGRLDMLDGRPAAALAYSHGAHRINLIVQRDLNNQDAHCNPERGFNLLCWRKDSLVYFLISDASSKDLSVLQKLLMNKN